MLIWLGLPSVIANATSTVGIWPGSLGSIWGFRRELSRTDRRMRMLVIPCLVGGAAGALLLRATTTALFDELVPFLVLFATVLFALRGAVQRLVAPPARGREAGEKAAGSFTGKERRTAPLAGRAPECCRPWRWRSMEATSARA